MNKEPENVKIDINGSVSDSAKGILGAIGGMALIAIILGCLFAPLFESFIKHSLMKEPNGQWIDMTKMQAVYDSMWKVRVILWIICIASWAFLIWCNVRETN